jgi:demethylmenaquinone methyltransferase/2-methoxy-6-polyprenyl-1,4-benzoquinol methylase
VSDDPRRRYDWWSGHQTLFRAASWFAFAGKERALRAAALDALALDSGETVLDVGCGPGPNFPALRDRVGGSGRVLGVDVSQGMVARARGRVADAGWRNVHPVRADAAALPLPDGALDAAYATLSLSAVPDLDGTLAELRRTLRPGGRLAVFDARPFQSGPGRLLNPVVGRVSRAATNWHPDRDVPAALDARFADCRVETANAGTAFVAVAVRR